MEINPNPTLGTLITEVRMTLERFRSWRDGHGLQGTNGLGACAREN
tara:strand:+ start:251 stop:388 length:138 start_codon:yes stop_codon:yes gene_type:complete